MDTLERTKILKLIQQEVIPAIGCTEPISVALCTAKATEILGTIPEKITVYLSANILKNAMGVGIPGTGMIGLPIAIALGALIGKSEYQLEVLKECTHEAVKRGKKMIDQKSISISLKENIHYGTKEHPISRLHFDTGAGTPYPEYFFVARHWHHYMEILYIEKGSFEFEINLQSFTLSQGDICILNPGDLHQIKGNSSDTKHNVILFDPCILDFSYEDEMQEKCIRPLINQLALLPNIYHCGSSIHAALSPKIKALMDTAAEMDYGWYMTSKLLILDIISSIYTANLMQSVQNAHAQTNQKKIQNYKSVISYMEHNYNQPVTLQDLADTIPCNSQYLCRFFKDIAGVSPIQYLLNYRIQKACILLETTNNPVLDIALDCGFENVSYFIRKFKEIMCCTPKAYRNNHTPR